MSGMHPSFAGTNVDEFAKVRTPQVWFPEVFDLSRMFENGDKQGQQRTRKHEVGRHSARVQVHARNCTDPELLSGGLDDPEGPMVSESD